MNLLKLTRLLQLASPGLPVGAFSYSQGLEAAVEARIVRDADTARRWVGDVLALSVASLEVPILLRLLRAWAGGPPAEAVRWNDEFIASRETAELRAETLQMGYSLRTLLRELRIPGVERLDGLEQASFPAAFAFAAAAEGIGEREAACAYLFAWAENQVLAALKAVPLGQTDAQRILRELGDAIPGHVERAAAVGDDELANYAPGLAHASARHEVQYSRLFRS